MDDDPAGAGRHDPVAGSESHDAADRQPSCESCGATMGAHDIFCGECGHVSGMVSRAFGGGSSPIAALPVEPLPEGAEERADDDLDEIEATRIVPPGVATDRFILQFSTGESVTANGSGLVGRNPLPEPGEYFDQLVRVIDPTRSVSKVHLEFGQAAGSFWVRDRFSGNGSVLREPGTEARRCDPGKRYPVIRGTRIDIGEQFFVVS